MNYLSCADVAKAMGVGIRRVQKMCKQGELPGALRMGHRWMIPKENVPSNSILSEFVGGSVFPV